MSKYGFKNFIRIADAKLNPDLNTLEGIEQWLKTWFCFTYNTTENDDRLKNMHLEDLIVLHQTHRLKEDPTLLTHELGKKPKDEEDYEKWLREEMGEEYISEEEMVQGMAEEEKEFQERMDKLKKKLPQKITTDFSQFNKD